ncbi:hypothetical protein GQ53DRAFT_754228 [Thozetella sp. PMI_491]|nr:hypothetical protein GQ53DRAFT_754228 [Thozetella sp. PMI_491]
MAHCLLWVPSLPSQPLPARVLPRRKSTASPNPSDRRLETGSQPRFQPRDSTHEAKRNREARRPGCATDLVHPALLVSWA